MLAEKGLDEQMAKDWAAIREKHTVEEPEPEQVAEAPAETPEAQTADGEATRAEGEAATAPDRTRDETGRFVKEPKAKPEKRAEAAAAPVQEQPTEPEAQAQRDVAKAPSSWKPTARAEWDKLSPAIKAEIHRREADFHTGRSQLLPDAQFGQSIRQQMEPYRLLIEAEGSTPEKAIADLMRTAAVLRIGTPEQKYAAFAQAARQYGIDLAVFAPKPNGDGQAAPQLPQTFRDPRVDQLLGHLQQQDQARQQREQADLEGTVTRWMNATDEKGEPRYPYLGDVINEMSALIPQLKQADPTLTHEAALQAAYERAIWASPEIRPLLQQQQQTALDAQRRTENQQRVANARRGASVNVPRRASTPLPGKPGSLEDTIRNTARELGLIT